MFIAIDDVRSQLGHDPFKAIVAPRPIGWISTRSAAGVANLAPYSFFNAISAAPDMLMFSSSGEKDSLTNCRETGEFVCNLVSRQLVDAMNQSSAAVAAEVNEFEWAGLASADSSLVQPARVADTPAALECVVVEVIQLKDRHGVRTDSWMTIGQVVGVYIDPDYLTSDGRFDSQKADAVARCGYQDYCAGGELFELPRPQ
ncbi:flavin reductase family protein [Litorivicinus lipolyticus]|uniref:flavin reductase family protein n=1 Tax=Litorivicinus lipolyticus TaxID=418701 RepID=UPI003B5998D7